MSKRMFNDQDAPRRGWLAQQAYVILVGRAMNHQVITYGELADRMDHPARNLGQNALEPIAAWCDQNGLLPLTIIVVSKNNGEPGEGYWGDPTKLIQVLQSSEWSRVVPPTPDELDAAWRNRPQS